MLAEWEIDDQKAVDLLRTYVKDHSNSFPALLGANWNARMKSQVAVFFSKDNTITKITLVAWIDSIFL